jgi:REP element-mobilizing transposase RayT
VEKFGGKYRSETHRMPKWDYGGNGIYFITIVTQDRNCHLGKIENRKIVLSELGKIVKEEWIKSFELRDELFLDEFIIMPNHIHALIGINKPKTNDSGENDNHLDTHGRAYKNNDVDTHGRAYQSEPPPHRQTHGRAYQNEPPPQKQTHDRAHRHAPDTQADQESGGNQVDDRKLQRKPKSISSFIAGFKSAVTNKIDDYIDDYQLDIPKFDRRNKFWQNNYHDRIIKTDSEYWNVKRYIVRNPEDWDEDEYFRPR